MDSAVSCFCLRSRSAWFALAWLYLSSYSWLGWAGGLSSVAVSRGPLYPGPYALAIRSKACRSVVSWGVAPMSSWPRCSENIGTIRGASSASATSPQASGWAVTVAAHRLQSVAAPGRVLGRRKAGSFAPNACLPASDSIAGSSVIAASTAVNTATALA